jgi:hypothetical protein
MSDQSAPATAPKTKLSALLEKATLISQGADKAGRMPGTAEYDEDTAPGVAMRWCASVLRIFLLRVIEHIIKTRADIAELQKVTKGLTEQTGEMSKLLGEIVSAIKAAQAQVQGGDAAPAADGANGDGAATEKVELEDAQTQAQIDELAAKLARGEKVDLVEATARPPEPPPVVPIQVKRNRNPAGNEKA